jgi:hypothetical protein
MDRERQDGEKRWVTETEERFTSLEPALEVTVCGGDGSHRQRYEERGRNGEVLQPREDSVRRKRSAA